MSTLDSKWGNLTQSQWKKELQSLLLVSDKALEKAIVRIWEQQTYTEQTTGQALLEDGVGFNKFDASLMSDFAKQLISGTSLSNKQKGIARKIMPKYWKQLMRISKAQHGWA